MTRQSSKSGECAETAARWSKEPRMSKSEYLHKLVEQSVELDSPVNESGARVPGPCGHRRSTLLCNLLPPLEQVRV